MASASGPQGIQDRYLGPRFDLEGEIHEDIVDFQALRVAGSGNDEPKRDRLRGRKGREVRQRVSAKSKGIVLEDDVGISIFDPNVQVGTIPVKRCVRNGSIVVPTKIGSGTGVGRQRRCPRERRDARERQKEKPGRTGRETWATEELKAN